MKIKCGKGTCIKDLDVPTCEHGHGTIPKKAEKDSDGQWWQDYTRGCCSVCLVKRINNPYIPGEKHHND